MINIILCGGSGSGIDISIKELALLVKSIVGFKGDLYFNTDKPDGTMVKLTNPTRLHSLGWKHQVILDEGIKNISIVFKR